MNEAGSHTVLGKCVIYSLTHMFFESPLPAGAVKENGHTNEFLRLELSPIISFLQGR